ncbi:WXG100 family type VII secretion target [Nocardioides sp. CPCC 205120]|uniref:WXG100 family type VII secretion target n=1 Tax=Nocardioides sp. CPCC 205120 TaxID=3406462 RepID=UPI003B5024F7
MSGEGAEGSPYLVAEGDSSTWHTGGAVADTLTSAGEALGRGDWLEGGLLTLCGVAEVDELLTNPFQSLLAAGIGWVMEKFRPLHELLDAVAGNPDEVLSFAETWSAVAAGLAETADEYRAEVAVTTAAWEGASSDAYLAWATTRSLAVDACAAAATGVSGAVRLASSLVAGVRQLVRETIAGVVAWLMQWSAVLVSGIGTGPILSRLAFRVRAEAHELGATVRRVVSSVEDLSARLAQCTDDVERTVTFLRATARTAAAVPGMVTAPAGARQTVLAGGVRHSATYDDV